MILEAIRTLAHSIAAQTAMPMGSSGNGCRTKIDTRHAKMEEFSGKKEDWGDQAFSFKKMIKTRCKIAYDRIVEMEDSDVDEDLLDQTEELSQLSAEL